MKVTDVRLRKIQTDGRMKALVSITLDEAFVIHDLRVIEGNSGLFVAMPTNVHQMVNSAISHIQSIQK